MAVGRRNMLQWLISCMYICMCRLSVLLDESNLAEFNENSNNNLSRNFMKDSFSVSSEVASVYEEIFAILMGVSPAMGGRGVLLAF